MDHDGSFAQLLKQRRKALDVTQQELAQRVGCAPVTIQRIEQGTLRPSRQVVQRLATIFELPTDEHVEFVRLARNRPTADEATATDTAGRAPWSRLPAPLTSLIGREAEVATVAVHLRQADVRLVTLTGPGGIGKTRLAIAVALHTQDDFADGVVFVDLAPVRDPALVVGALAAALDVQEVADQSLIESVQAYLRGKQLLLVLDNFEQVVAAAPLLDEVLRAGLLLKLLVTSRSVLGVFGEHVVEVPPLQLPQQIERRLAGSQVEKVAQVEAIHLFVERAVAANATFVLNDGNVEAVVGICQRVDGLPLGIELAAARTRLLPPPVLLQRLAQRLPILTGGPRTLPARQQTLLKTIEWSYDLLTPGQQRLLRRLAIFVGGCTLEAAEAVCQAEADTAVDILDGMQALIDQSLVRVLGADRSEPRYTMLETIREYAHERLATGHELAETSRRHANYCLGFAETVEPHLRSKEQLAWFGRLEREHDNLRAALDWLIARREIEAALRMGAALAWFWYRRGRAREGQERLVALLAAVGVDVQQVAVDHLPPSRALAQVLLGASQCFLATTWQPQAVAPALAALLTASIRVFRELGDPRELGIALAFRGLYHWLDDEHEDVEAYITESADLLLGCDDAWAAALAQLCVSETAMYGGDDPLERFHGEEAGRLFREIGDSWGIAFALYKLGQQGWRQGDSRREIAAYEASLVTLQEAGDMIGIADILDRLAGALRWQGEYDRATTVYAESIELYRELSLQAGLAAALHGRGYVALWMGHIAEAKRLFSESMRLFCAIDHASGIGWCCHGLAGVAGLAGAPGARRAARLLGAATNLIVPLMCWPPAPRAEYERVVTAARAQLDAATWDAAWTEGLAMTLEQALAYALDMVPLTRDAGNASPPPGLTSAVPPLPAALTVREAEVLRLVAQGLTDNDVAARLIISARTVHAHLQSIYSKLGVNSRTAATRFALDHSLV